VKAGDLVGSLPMRLDALIMYVEVGGAWDTIPKDSNVVALTITGVFAQAQIFGHLVLKVIVGPAEPRMSPRLFAEARPHVPAPIHLDSMAFQLLVREPPDVGAGGKEYPPIPKALDGSDPNVHELTCQLLQSQTAEVEIPPGLRRQRVPHSVRHQPGFSGMAHAHCQHRVRGEVT
jgi:hypothetical protein